MQLTSDIYRGAWMQSLRDQMCEWAPSIVSVIVSSTALNTRCVDSVLTANPPSFETPEFATLVLVFLGGRAGNH